MEQLTLCSDDTDQIMKSTVYPSFRVMNRIFSTLLCLIQGIRYIHLFLHLVD